MYIELQTESYVTVTTYSVMTYWTVWKKCIEMYSHFGDCSGLFVIVGYSLTADG